MLATRVHPIGPSWSSDGRTSATRQNHTRLLFPFGLFYVLSTATISVLYLNLLSPSVANDFWWPHFTTPGIQTFLGDLYTAKTTLHVTGSLDLFAATSLLVKDYSTGTAFISMRPAAARAILLDQLPLQEAIRIMRSISLIENIRTVAPSCWLDFNRTYEMAHTALRQAACNSNRTTNAAVYLESLLRNVQTSDLLASTYYPEIQGGIFAAVQLTPMGAAWVNAIETHIWPSVADEESYWRAFGITTFKNQLQNYYLEGMDDGISIVNALGISSRITIHSRPAIARSKGSWSTQYATCGFWNDLDSTTQTTPASSLIRSAPNAFERLGYDWDMWYNGPAGTPATVLIRTQLSPLANFDVNLVPVPASLLRLVAAFQDILFSRLSEESSDYVALDEPIVDATPNAWMTLPNAVFYGGNPLCPYGKPLPYIQPSFGYDDDCGLQIHHQIQLTRDALLFAILAHQAKDMVAICAQCFPASTCVQTLRAAKQVYSRLFLKDDDNMIALVALTLADILPLNISFLQWATVNGIDQILHQAIVPSESESDPWSFFGWMTLYDWATGHREVYTFEGDYATVTLMSQPHAFAPLAAIAAELPRNGCTYLWAVTVYVSLVLIAVLALAVLVCLYYFPDQDARNLFQCNRVAGSAWVGRPFLFLRGMTAIFVLSTSPVVFSPGGSTSPIARLDLVPRPLWHMCVLAGEATWLAYVAQDFLVPLTQPHTSLYAPISTALAWLTLVVLDATQPFHATATLDHACSIVSFTGGVQCTSGTIMIGNFGHVIGSCSVVAATLVVAYALVRSLHSRPCRPPSHVIFPSASEAFLVHEDLTNHDVLACVLSGLVPIGRRNLFDIKLWITFEVSQSTFTASTGMLFQQDEGDGWCSSIVAQGDGGLFSFKSATFQRNVVSKVEVERRKLSIEASTTSFSMLHFRTMGLLGLAYMFGAVFSSFVFLSFSQTILVNDFLWAGFDGANTHAFLANFFNTNLQMANPMQSTQLTNVAFGALATTTNDLDMAIHSSVLYANTIQDEVNSNLLDVIHGLRRMDPCLLPWIATAYCYVDLNQRWPLAWSRARQVRCASSRNNGAMYLELTLRNAKSWPELASCWGDALNVAVLAALRDTNDGQVWIEETVESHDVVSPTAELAYWQRHGIQDYRTQWQNFKRLGVYESFVVVNAIGVQYSLTLKHSNSSFQLSAATSFVMHWGLANTLAHMTTNGSLLACRSLVSTSPYYAFLNGTTPEAVLAGSNVLPTPLDPAFAAFASTIGPFGVVDLHRVDVPETLRGLYRTMLRFVMAKLTTSTAIETAFWRLYKVHFFNPKPLAWDSVTQWGGDLNCGMNYGGASSLPFLFFSTNGICGNYLSDFISTPTQNVILALLAAGLTNASSAHVVAIANRDATHQVVIADTLNATIRFLTLYCNASELGQFNTENVVAYIRDTLALSLVQYVGSVSTISLSRVNVFAPSESSLAFFSWLYLFDWVEGKREVVTFQGDVGFVTTLSATQNLDARPANRQEIPQNVSFYILRVVQYITVVLFGVGCLVCTYIVSSKGYVEGLHMIPFNLVAGHVWIGRPLMLLRGLTAVCMLSTSMLHLTRSATGLVSYFMSAAPAWFSILLSAGEMSWLVYVVVDACSLVTREFTAGYSTLSAIVVCLSVALWMLASPTTHSATVTRDCTIVTVDFDVLCSSGSVTIGDVSRFYRLIGATVVGTALSYLVERVRHPLPPPQLKIISFMLYSAAKHEFEQGIHVYWEHDGIYYVDKASAVLTGIVTFEYRGAMVLFDIKTWRAYTVESVNLGLRGSHLPPRLNHAVPLFE
ncbi:Aste57867_17910 [Aphanomyces stellatus]|uniref:Aste57867_17910 protein n=1 Tax=Aphanomyces stellatus TaxID=120398 RepID=A0A485L922_9STRA|nr:hypothetical protein As57867_017849 [Aphanomyces stellatus]VFT94652.1 Aste57867_17910 [Aphanomyces stellatus]